MKHTPSGSDCVVGGPEGLFRFGADQEGFRLREGIKGELRASLRRAAGVPQERQGEGDSQLTRYRVSNSSAKWAAGDGSVPSLLGGHGLERLAAYRRRNLHFANYLDGHGFIREGSKLADCGTGLVVECGLGAKGIKLVRGKFCAQPFLCPICARIRASKRQRVYDDRIAGWAGKGLIPALLTLTVKSGLDLGERVQTLLGGLECLLGRARRARGGGRNPSEFQKIAGGVASIELMRGKGGEWHPHMHAVVLLGDWIDQRAMSAEWASVTDGSYIVHVKRITPGPDDSLQKSLREVFKYPMKFSELDHADALGAFLVAKGKRLLRSWGCLYGVDAAVSSDSEDAGGAVVGEYQLDPYQIGYVRLAWDYGSDRYVRIDALVTAPDTGGLWRDTLACTPQRPVPGGFDKVGTRTERAGR